MREERVSWITTGGNDGTPLPNPVGFRFQEDSSIRIYNMVDANRISDVVDRPQVARYFDGDGSSGDIVVFAGMSRCDR